MSKKMKSYKIPRHFDTACSLGDFRQSQICKRTDCPYHTCDTGWNDCKLHTDYMRTTENGRKDSMILSVHPKYAEMIYDGTKTVELRRNWPVKYDRKIYIYETSPVQAITGSFYVDEVQYGQRPVIYDRLLSASGITANEFLDYFEGAAVAYAIFIRDVDWFSTPIPLSVIKAVWPAYRPPVSYRYANWVQMGMIQAEAELQHEDTVSTKIATNTCTVGQKEAK